MESLGVINYIKKLFVFFISKKNKENYKFQLSLITLFIIIINTNSTVYAEGTKTWQPDPLSRSDLYITSPTSNSSGVRSFAGYLSQPNMKMYVHIENPSNEMVYLGFSGSGYTFRIVSPTGAIVHGEHTVSAPNITSYNLAFAGPDVLGNGGYPTTNAMFKFDPQGLPAGDYSIEFGSDISMSWFDITVTTKDTIPQEIQGRLWSQAWQVNCGSFTSALKAKLYARDEKGYVTQVNFAEAGIKPYVGQFSFNDTGTGSTGNVAIDRQSVPNAQSGNPVQKVFLNQPDPTVYPLGIDGELQNLPLKVEDPTNPNITIEATQSGRVEVVLDFGVIGNYSEAIDRRLFMDINAGSNTLIWDGLRGDGQPVQPRDYPIPVTISYTQGETHFTAYDVEYLDESFVVRTQTTAGLTGPNVLFWDDSRITQSPNLPPDQKVNTDVGSIARQPWSNFDYGNVNTINTWWFSYRDYVTSTILMPGDYGDAPDSYGGATHKVTAIPTVYLGTLAPDEENYITTPVNGTGDDADGSDDEDAFATLPNLYTTDTSYALTVPCSGVAKVAGWIDFDQSGAFEADERSEADCITGNAGLSWTGLNSLSTGTTYVRLRTATNVAEIANPIGGASDGEVEDYALLIRENRVAGTITDTLGTTMENITVSIKDASGSIINNTNGQPLSTTTDATGLYSLSGIPEGDYHIVIALPTGYIGINDGDTTVDGDVNANVSPTDGIIPLSITKTKEDTDNNFALALLTNNAITQCSAGNIADQLIEYKLGNIVEGAGFVNIGDVRTITDIARINGLQIDAKITIIDIQTTSTSNSGLELLDNGLFYIHAGIPHSTDNSATLKIDFIEHMTGNPAAYNFSLQITDIDGETGNSEEYVRFSTSELAETMVANPTNLLEVTAYNYREYRGTALENGTSVSTVDAIYNQQATINLTFGQRDTNSNVGFQLTFEQNKFLLPFCHGYDFGDAQGYNTTGATAAKHGVVNGLYLGTHVDIDNGTQEDSTAIADDENGLIDATTRDDEESIATFPELNDLDTTYNVTVNVTNTTGRTANLIGWIDVDNNGIFDLDEASLMTTIPSGTNATNVSVDWRAIPTDIVAHNSYLRLRLTTDSLSASDMNGKKIDGEVEDYTLTIKVGGFPVRGRVYNDSNVNGNNDASEKGISGLPIVLLDTTNNVCVSTKTAGDGRYSFFPVIPGNYQLYEASREKVPTPDNCDTTQAKDPIGYRSTTTNVLAPFRVIDTEITGKDFGDVKTPLFKADNSSTVLAGNVVFYAHTFTPNSIGTVSFNTTNSTPTTTGWLSIIYQDTNCNSKLDGIEANTPILSSIATTAGTPICLINRVYAPSNVISEETYSNVITANFNFNSNTLAGNIQLTVTDLSKASTNKENSKLVLRKTVQNMSQIGALETETQNQAQPGDILQYRIYYRNTGTGMITDLIVNDTVPEFTLLEIGSMRCDTTPTDLNCTPNPANDPALSWNFTGVLQGGAQGWVSYSVKVE